MTYNILWRASTSENGRNAAPVMGVHIAYECRTAENGNDLVATAVDFVMNMHAVVAGNCRDLAMGKSNQWNISMRRA